MSILQTKKITKVYNEKSKTANSYRALTDVNLSVERGEFLGIMGPSGSGKTTLLNIISTIDDPTSGEVLINDKDIHKLSKNDLAKFRRRELGFIFQDFNLLDTLTIGENILLPLMLENQNVKSMKQKLFEISSKLGISGLLEKRIYEVSGGQVQRAAIARAVINKPVLILADEPTGSLDSKSSKNVMEILQNLNEEDQATIILITHCTQTASYCNRVVFLRDGRICGDVKKQDSTRQEFSQKITHNFNIICETKDEIPQHA